MGSLLHGSEPGFWKSIADLWKGSEVSFILIPEFLKLRIGQDDFIRRVLLVMTLVPVAVDACLVALFVSAVSEVF